MVADHSLELVQQTPRAASVEVIALSELAVEEPGDSLRASWGAILDAREQTLEDSMPTPFTRLGFQIPNFNFPNVPNAALFDRVVAMAGKAEESGFDTLFVMDHFYQLPMLGPAEWNMLEAYTLLGALAARTQRARLGTLVTGNTYRNPALLGKIVTSLDVISGGRALLGIGAGWFEQEHTAFGFEFGSFSERFLKLEEALAILKPMLRDERPSFEGRFYKTKEIINQPPRCRTLDSRS